MTLHGGREEQDSGLRTGHRRHLDFAVQEVARVARQESAESGRGGFWPVEVGTQFLSIAPHGA